MITINLYPILAIAHFMIIIAQLIFNALATTWWDEGGKLFPKSVYNVTNEYILKGVPEDWFSPLWIFIYSWKVTWSVYTVINLCRSSGLGDGYRMYEDPPFIPSAFIFQGLVCGVLNVIWLVLYTREKIVAAYVIILVYTIVKINMLGITSLSMNRFSKELADDGRKVDVWIVRFLVIEGVAIHAAWLTIATILNLSMVIQYEWEVLSVYETTLFSILTVAIMALIWFIIDLVFLDRYLRYAITPYIIGFIYYARVKRNTEYESDVFVINTVFIALLSIFFLVKVIVMSMRSSTRYVYGLND